jgi:hypothetical protein
MCIRNVLIIRGKFIERCISQPTLGCPRKMRWAWHVARMGDKRRVYRVLVARPEGRSPLIRPRNRWEDIKMDSQDVGRAHGLK